MLLRALYLVVAAAAALAGAEPQHVALRAPLATIVHVTETVSGPTLTVSGPTLLEAEVEVPADAPADLGVGAWIANPDGRWYQRCSGPLAPGASHLSFRLAPGEALTAEGHRAAWNAAEAAEARQAGLFFYSAAASGVTVTVRSLTSTPCRPASAPPVLLDLDPDGMAGGSAHAATGERWTVTCRPQPLPADPYDPDEFALDAVLTGPDGAELHVPGFYEQPMRGADRGDEELVEPSEAAHFAVRFRPRVPGTWRVRLEARWKGGTLRSVALPPLVVAGRPWDGYARVDAKDKRFFSVDGAFLWPVGINLRSVNDVRGHDRMGTKITPDRGSLSYAAYLQRFAAAGADLVEVWMSSWNLALEWRAGWPGYAGIGRYNQANAWRLDQVLDEASRDGVRVNLVINNHGQASPKPDREWPNNPWNVALGGPLGDPAEIFTDRRALTGQEHLRRYLIARYADSPAILGWKLWSEVNLTAGRGEPLRAWHEQAAARWHALDVYGHGVTTHWAGDYHVPDRAITTLPGIDYVCIDAYHGNRGRPGGGKGPATVVDLICDSVNDPSRGFGVMAKPLVVTEFGGSAQGCPEPQMEAEQTAALWAGLVSGTASSPLIWWYEWVDQGARWRPYRAIRAFIAGEDLRSPHAHSLPLAVVVTEAPAETVAPESAASLPLQLRLHARAWWADPRLIGYLVDMAWATDGVRMTEFTGGVQVRLDVPLGEGEWRVEWWDADEGVRVAKADFAVGHDAAPVVLGVPAFKHHLAFKVFREEAASGGTQ